MDDVLDQIREACAGKSVEEIESEIMASQHADKIREPSVLAAYFASLAAPEEEGSEGSELDE